MAKLVQSEDTTTNMGTRLFAWLGRIFFAAVIPLLAFFVIYQGFIFLRDSQAPRWVIALVAIVWGVGGVGFLLGFQWDCLNDATLWTNFAAFVLWTRACNFVVVP